MKKMRQSEYYSDESNAEEGLQGQGLDQVNAFLASTSTTTINWKELE